MSSTITCIATKRKDDHEYDDDDVALPGFRFHPTDEELVGFYLRRKVEKKPIKFELIKEADIYKYDPWDLPKESSNKNGDKEWYFFCQRGRKYKNSIRPNRVTGSGFWKATGIDKPIYSSSNGGEARNSRVLIGLKKSLVYYRGSAGKGTKTEWMMHEFRLPSPNSQSPKNNKPGNASSTTTIDQEAEVWTLCRILKRGVSYNKRRVQDLQGLASNNMISTRPTMADYEDDLRCNSEEIAYYGNIPNIFHRKNQQLFGGCHLSPAQPTSLFSSSAAYNDHMNELVMHADWEELRNTLDFAAAANYYPFCL